MSKVLRDDSFDSSLDSSFDVNSGGESDDLDITSTPFCSTNSTDSASMSESECSFSDIEVWDNVESDSSEVEGNDITLNKTISATLFFLVFYHLTYRLSERAIKTLIGFLRALFHFLSSVTGHALLLSLATAFPRTLYGACLWRMKL